MTAPKRRQRPTAPRLLCSAETLEAVEAALPAQIGATGRMVSKTALVDALIAVALRTPEAITAELRKQTDD